MKRRSAIISLTSVITLAGMISFAAGKEVQKPYPHYWMSVATQNMSIPGMSAEMPAMGGMFGGMGAFGPKRELNLQLESPRTAQNPEAVHEIPPGQNMGTSLPLLTPVVEKKDRSEQYRQEKPEQFEKPKMRMLIYWGCGETIGKGQPRVIDTEKMTPADYGKSLAGHSPSPQYPPSPKKGWTYGDWPNNDNKAEVPKNSSLAGGHAIKGNYVPDIRFSLDSRRDFMAPVEFTSMKAVPNGALNVEWKSVPTATGYFASAMAHNQQSGETIIWSSSELADPGYGLHTYLSNSDVSRFIKEKVVMDPARTSCTVPPIFKDAQGAMLQFIAYGDELNIVHPPRPKDPKQPWEPLWSVKVRLKSTGSSTLMAMDENRREKPAKRGKQKTKSRDEESRDDDRDDNRQDPEERSEKPKSGVKDQLRGLFGF